MRTILHDRHCALGAKIVPFAGWEMPVQYKGIIAEHQAVRQQVGLFDVSHMGRILVSGPDAEQLLDYLSTNQIVGKPDGSATYTVWCHASGTVVDDVMIYKENATHFFVIVNAGNRQKDLQHLLHHSSELHVHIQDRFQDEGILSLQGPMAEKVLSRFIPTISTLKPMRFLQAEPNLIVARTGYTGAGGYELYARNDQIVIWWDRLINEGAEPIGLGARDTLRLEMGFALYGHELSDAIYPDESVAAWTIKNDHDFLGKVNIQKNSPKRHAYGIQLLGRGIAREGFSVYKNNEEIGIVTSGSFSPTLNQAIALILVQKPFEVDEMVEVEIRQQRVPAKIVQIPFVRKTA